MINEISVHPKAKNNYAKIFSLVSMLLAVICIIAYSNMQKYRGIVGVVAVMFIVTAVLIYTKYISVDFYYDISFDSEDIPIFVVRQRIGKRQTTLCRLNLWDMETIEYQSAEQRRARKRASGVRGYVYTPTMFPKETYILRARSRYEMCDIIIECSSEFAELMREYIAEAKTMRVEDEEE